MPTLPVRALALLGAAVFSASCYSPSLQEGFNCATDEPRCPAGFECRADNRCYREGGGPDIDSGAGLDASVLDGSVIPRAQPVQIGDGRSVKIGRTNNGARVAFEDALGPTAVSPAAIRYIDIDDKGKASGELSLVSTQDRQRNLLAGDGDTSAAFVWAEIDGTSLALRAAVGGNPSVEVSRVGLVAGGRRVADVAVSKDEGFVAYSEGQNLILRRIRMPLETALTVTTVGTNVRVEEIDLATSDDGAQLFVLWREVSSMSTTEVIRIARVAVGTLAFSWTGGVMQVTSVSSPLAHPKLAISRPTSTVIVTYEVANNVEMRTINYGMGTVGNSLPSAQLTQPQPLVFPLTGSVAGSPTIFLGAIRRGVRGPMFRRQMQPQGALLDDLGTGIAAPFGVGDKDNVAYFGGQEGNDTGGDLIAWSSHPSWPIGGLVVNRNARQVRSNIAATAANLGGLYLAWIEQGADEGQVWVQSFRADSTTLANP